jgi:hypothetical protein
MLNKLMSCIAIAAISVMVAGSASAAVMVPGGSYLQVNLAALPNQVISAEAWGGASLTNGTGGNHDVGVDAGLFSTAGRTMGTALMTGVALVVNMTLTLSNGAGAFSSNFGPTPNPWGGNLTVGSTPSSGTLCTAGCLGGLGTGVLSGNAILNAGGGIFVPFPLGAVGAGGTAMATLGGAPLVATGGPWITGKVRVTNITTNIISITSGPRVGLTGAPVTVMIEPSEVGKNKIKTIGGLLSHTAPTGWLPQTVMDVRFGGTQNLASSATGGVVTLISPVRVDTGAIGQGIIPGVFTMHLKFAPEPGTVLLLASGAAGLVLLGRKRMKS